MHPENKNSYLHARTTICPRIINRSVDKAREQETIDQFDAFPPFNRVTSEQPCIPITNCDVTRRPVAFGRWAMPKLRRELHHINIKVVMQAVNSIGDLVHDPERNIEAIKLRIPDRMVNLLENENTTIRERTCMALTTMAGLLDGKTMIVNNKHMLTNIKHLLLDHNMNVRMKAIALLERLAQVWMVADVLVENGFIEFLIERIGDPTDEKPLLDLYLATLHLLMYCDGKTIAMQNGLYELCLRILNETNDDAAINETLKCLSTMTGTAEGKVLALKHKLIKKLYVYLKDERPLVYEGAAAAMLFATIKTEAIAKAMKFKDLPDRLLQLAKNYHEPTTQKYCLQIIANLCGHGKIKKQFMEKYWDEIANIHTNHDEAVERAKHILMVDVFVI